MASIFTYDPDPPRVSSPWLTPRDSGSSTPQPVSRLQSNVSRTPPPSILSDYKITKLEPEPQTTSTEYKLHLLLRPRRQYSSSTTGLAVPGSYRLPTSRPESSYAAAPGTIRSLEYRQHRLEQLTTQLLWRLQQSSPYHATSSSELILPKLPEATEKLQVPARPAKLIAGLAESRGALYEIGVSDDGSLIGLTDEEMEESVTNLRAMAASLGCVVEVLKMVEVGHCEWKNHPEDSSKSQKDLTMLDLDSAHFHRARLWVVEALVTPDINHGNREGKNDTWGSPDLSALNLSENVKNSSVSTPIKSCAEQLRITLTGPTTSGKSSLLGTLSTATLDNGRGKSRLSLLKHRHELVSGITSSVAQEVIGYTTLSSVRHDAKVVNFASGNVSSWTDIHASVADGRLVFVCDSAGHPRYRRTTVRGLVGWAPDWVLLCIAADDAENAPSGVGGTSSAQEILGIAGAGIDLAKAHLELCLKLEKPLIIVITKLDLASRSSLRQTLSKILSAVKSAGRTPLMLPADQDKSIFEPDLHIIPEIVAASVRKSTLSLNPEDLTNMVPIIMTSAAKGTGIRQLHALLQSLPIPRNPTSRDYISGVLNPEQPACLFHIEEIFGFPASHVTHSNGGQIDSGTVVAGHLRFGTVSVGDKVVIGPFPVDSDDSPSSDRQDAASSSPKNGYRPFSARSLSETSELSTSHNSNSELSRLASHSARASITAGEFHPARIVSIRNLRLPVHSLGPGQVGTIGIVFDSPSDSLKVSTGSLFESAMPTTPRIRKGMVLAVPSQSMLQTGHTLQAASGFTASFEDEDVNSVTAGNLVVVYVASVRASAKVVRLVPHANSSEVLAQQEAGDQEIAEFEIEDGGEGGSEEEEQEDGDGEGFFPLGDDRVEEDKREPAIFGTDGITDVTFELMTSREWIELGSQVLIMPGGGQGLYYGSERGEKGVAGLEGFVGRVIEVVE